MRTRGLVGIVLAGGLLVGCGGPSDDVAAPTSARGPVLRLETAGGMIGVRPAAGEGGTAEVVYRAGAAVAAPSGEVLYRAEPAGPGSTIVVGIDGATGAERSRQRVEGSFQVRAVGARGHLVVLGARRDPGADPYGPVPKDRSAIAVLDTRDGSVVRHDLAGNYEPEALALDGGSVFVVEFRPPLAPETYRVRSMDVASGLVQDVFSPDKELQEDMKGSAHRQVASSDGRRLYTLYSLDVQGTQEAFVHVLDLEGRWAHCVDLPVPFGVAPESALALALDPAGRRLFVLDAQAGRVAEVDTADLTVKDAGALPAGLRWSEQAPLHAAASGGLVYAAAGPAVAVVEPGRRTNPARRLDGDVPAVGVLAGRNGIFVWSTDTLWRVDAGGGALSRQALPAPIHLAAG